MGFDLILADTTFWVNRGRMMGLRCLWNSTWMVNWWRYRSAVCQLGIIALSVKPQFVSIQSVNILSLADFVWLSEGLCVVFVMSFFFFCIFVRVRRSYLTCEILFFFPFFFFFFLVGEEGFPFDTRNAQVERIQAHTHTHEAVCSKIYSGMPPDCRHFSVVSVKQYDTPWFKNGTSCIRVSDMSSDFKAIRETENIVGIGLNSHFRNGVIFPRVAFEGHNYYE